jgi:hypothetical protein
MDLWINCSREVPGFMPGRVLDVSLTNFWERFDVGCALHSPVLADRAMAKLLDQPKWRARALRRAPETEPCRRVAA